MISKLLGLAVALTLPSIMLAQTPQIPNVHASDRAQAMVALHSQGAAHRALHRRGDVVTRNPNAATPAIRATPAVPGHGDSPTIPTRRATPAVPAHKGGQSASHRP